MCCSVDLTSWQMKIADDISGVEAEGKCQIEAVDALSDSRHQQQQQQLYDGGILTIGCCGLYLFVCHAS